MMFLWLLAIVLLLFAGLHAAPRFTVGLVGFPALLWLGVVGFLPVGVAMGFAGVFLLLVARCRPA